MQLLEQTPSQTQAKVLSNYVANVEWEKILNFIVDQIRFWDIIVKVVDILDFEAT